ncbi:MAG: hypothetical protein ACI4Q3_02565 [Kiritimatiellia bacterium]
MKKLTIALCAVMMGVATARAEFIWSWWAGNPGEVVTKDVSGCVLGFASEAESIKGAQVSLCYSKTKQVKSGCQYAVGYSQAGSVRNGAQVACVCRAKEASLQFGLVCINDTGFLPWFVFFNFSKGCFGPVK